MGKISVSNHPKDIEARKVKVAAMLVDGSSQNAITKEAGCSHKMVKAVKSELASNPDGKIARQGAALQKEHLNKLLRVSHKALGKVDTLMDTDTVSLRDMAVTYGILQDKYLKATGQGDESKLSIHVVVDSLKNRGLEIDGQARVISVD